MIGLDLNTDELKERLLGVTDIQQQWSIVFVMYMEDYEKNHPDHTITTDDEMADFIQRVSNQLVSNGTISKNSDGQFVLPKLNIFE